MAVRIHMDGRVLVIQGAGEYATAELVEAWLHGRELPAFGTARGICLDVRESSSLAKRSVEDLRGVTEWFIAHAAEVGGRCALVTRPGVQYGLMRMAAAWVELKSLEAEVFTDLAEATAWLDRDS